MKYREQILRNWRFVLWAMVVFSCTGHDEAKIENTITDHIIHAIDDGYCVGTSIAFYDNGHERYFCYGFTDTTHKDSISKMSVFEIGSISKTFTSLLLADLVEKGKMQLVDPVDQYLPDSVRMPLVAGNKITLANLASHTSGLPRMPTNFNSKDSTNPYADYSIGDLFTFLDSIQFRNSNKHYEYSNLAVGLLGVAEMNVTGKTYNQLVQDIICKPLGMTETSILNTSPFMTTGHRGTYPVNHSDLNALVGAGGIRSNTDDLLRYLKAQMGLTKSELLPAMKLTQKPLHDAGNKMKVGLGWHFTFTDGDTIVWHSGGTEGYRTFAGFCTRTKRAIIILNNSAYSPDELGMYFFDQTTKIPPIKRAINIPWTSLQEKVGVYKIVSKQDGIKPGSVIKVVLDNNQLKAQLTGTPWVDIFPESQNTFYTKQGQIIAFKDSASHKSAILIVHYPGGLDLSAQKLK